MKPSSGDKQLGMLSPLKSAAMQSGQTKNPSQDEVGLDVSHHIHLSLEGRGKYFFLDILFHRMSANAWFHQPTVWLSWRPNRASWHEPCGTAQLARQDAPSLLRTPHDPPGSREWPSS